MKIIVTCTRCNKEFKKEKQRVTLYKKKGWNLYCSKECSGKASSERQQKRIKTNCKNCGKEIERKFSQYKLSKNHFCSHSCSASYNNLGVAHNKPKKKNDKCVYCNNDIKRGKKFCNTSCQRRYRWNEKVKIIEETQEVKISKIESVNRRYAKKYLIEKRGHKCSICNNTDWLGEPIPLVIDHIDGNSENNELSNFRLVCGNCNMKLPTFAGKNRGNGRKHRRKRYLDGKSY